MHQMTINQLRSPKPQTDAETVAAVAQLFKRLVEEMPVLLWAVQHLSAVLNGPAALPDRGRLN